MRSLDHDCVLTYHPLDLIRRRNQLTTYLPPIKTELHQMNLMDQSERAQESGFYCMLSDDSALVEVHRGLLLRKWFWTRDTRFWDQEVIYCCISMLFVFSFYHICFLLNLQAFLSFYCVFSFTGVSLPGEASRRSHMNSEFIFLAFYLQLLLSLVFQARCNCFVCMIYRVRRGKWG